MEPRRLIELKRVLEKNGFSLSQRGNGQACFLFVKGKDSSAEISIHHDEFWIEFWDSADEESNDEPVKQITCTTVEDTYKVLLSGVK